MKLLLALILIHSSLFQIRICSAAVREVHFHIDIPTEGVMIRELHDLTPYIVYSPGLPESSGIVLNAPEMAATALTIQEMLRVAKPLKVFTQASTGRLAVSSELRQWNRNINPKRVSHHYTEVDRLLLRSISRKIEELSLSNLLQIFVSNEIKKP